jgi:hypothetical protein
MCDSLADPVARVKLFEKESGSKDNIVYQTGLVCFAGMGYMFYKK